ncbi:hypothetical protein QN277_024640 [Acacia crassicarpa]|uniref:LOB domain-containing protein n=1 Tax=Acacia crassicarpa TaxID=499986 RepID=A0AAE1JCP1_9FABA|nr:hypothetical protein QN277_024640 [Acacia crassicarpa]
MSLSHSNNNNSNNQACAACKFRRRKCAPDCILAPYFPHDRQCRFLNAHKLFGVRNIIRIIEDLDPQDKDKAMQSIIFHSDMRAIDPVGGCYKYIQQLEAQIQYHTAQLNLVLQHLAVFRHHHEPINIINSNHLNLYNPNIAPSSSHHQDPYLMVQEHHINDVVNVPNLQDNEDFNSWALLDSASLSLHNKNHCHDDDQSGFVSGDELYNGQKTSSSMLDIHHCDERNEISIEPEELLEHSDEAILFKVEDGVVNEEINCVQQVQDHDLKGAATLFTLTNCTS